MAIEVNLPSNTLAYPPLELASRVGSLAGAPKALEYYDALGRQTRDAIVEALPVDWTFHGKRVLDFGCGAGRTLRHFAAEATQGEFWGCDIDEPSIAWMEGHMSPPFHVFVNGAEPPIEHPDASFDLIWAVSVFSHLATGWSRWLVEFHRLLKPDGLLLATFMGPGMVEEIAHEPWDETKFGMNVIRYGQGWDLGGPMVIHAPWWIEEHWGRAFQILSLVQDGFASKPWLDHGCVLMRKRGQCPDPAALERRDPADERESSSLAHNLEQLLTESKELRDGLSWVRSKLGESEADRHRLRSELSQSSDAMINLRQVAFKAEREVAAMGKQSALSASKLLKVEETLAQAKARIFALEEQAEELQESIGERQARIDEVQAQLERARGVMTAMQTSWSWRLTAPLRALKPRTRS